MGDLILGIASAAILLIFSFYNLLIAILGLFPKYRATAVGTLQNRRTQRNVRVKYGTLPVVTDYTYQYTVNGKKYKYSSSGQFTKRNLYQKVTLVYVKWFPRHAYPEKFTGTTQWICGLSLLFLGILMIVATVLA